MQRTPATLPGSVHPHIRGEYAAAQSFPDDYIGSSPHPWGIRDRTAESVVYHRFIPTSVGNTSVRGCPRLRSTVHPHIRGEYCLNRTNAPAALGSSPHPWGIPTLSLVLMSCRRFIPTSVGNTFRSRFSRYTRAVHPHIRGEYCWRLATKVGMCGSSPHPWGILRMCKEEITRSRFIPTSVGNTTGRWQESSTGAVHPHIRGEYATSGLPSNLKYGSSPHPWGILPIPNLSFQVLRFIPTSVGNTHIVVAKDELNTVHPHIRGEYAMLWFVYPVPTGSSPHPWGIHPRSDGCIGQFPVHPHIRGEYELP